MQTVLGWIFILTVSLMEHCFMLKVNSSVCVCACIRACHACHLDSINLHQLDVIWELGRRVCPTKQNRTTKKRQRKNDRFPTYSLIITGMSWVCKRLSVHVCVRVCLGWRKGGAWHTDPLCEVSLSAEVQVHSTGRKRHRCHSWSLQSLCSETRHQLLYRFFQLT